MLVMSRNPELPHPPKDGSVLGGRGWPTLPNT